MLKNILLMVKHFPFSISLFIFQLPQSECLRAPPIQHILGHFLRLRHAYFSLPCLLFLHLLVSICFRAFVEDSLEKSIGIISDFLKINCNTKSKLFIRLNHWTWNKLNWKSFLAYSYSFLNWNCTWKQTWSF